MRNLSNIYNQIASNYVKTNDSREEITKDLVEFAALLPQNSNLLDLGCGVGFDSRDFKKLRPDLNILGVDSSEEMLKYFKDITNGIKFINKDMLKIKFKPNSFDGIWMNASLLHIPKVSADKLLNNLFSWIKKDGYLYVKTKHGEGVAMIPATKYGRQDLERFFAFYNKQELQNLLTKGGFKVININDIKQREKWVIATAQKP